MSIVQVKPMRRSALISPWGVGAIVPFVNDESLMIAGLDMWRYGDTHDFVIEDERLTKRLGVKELRWPPDFRDYQSDKKNYNISIPAVRFPTWYYCPHCGYMKKTGLYTKQPRCDAPQWKDERLRRCNPNAKKGRRMIPERFIIACPNGHIDDFPVAEWLHSESGHTYNPDTCIIRRSTGGTSASLSGVRYYCSCGASKSIAAALNPNALERFGYQCKGAKPWLGIEEDPDDAKKCDTKKLKVVQRGATNIWFADTVSSIHIPTDSDEISRRIAVVVNQKHYLDSVRSHTSNGQIDREVINYIAEFEKVDADALYNAFNEKLNNIDTIQSDTTEMSEDEYRLAEYNVLIKSSGSDKLDFHSVNKNIQEYNSVIHNYFRSISLVKKLRETRAFIGFSRLEPYNNISLKDKKAMIRLGNGNWLPAVEVYGEGIFFEFSFDAITEWSQRLSVQKRIGILNHAYKNSFFGKNTTDDLRPEFVMMHTFAHLVINQLSYECGYGSSSIKERIYCERCTNDYDMCGVLIYTASGDSEGSLGGLVRRGEPGKIEDTVLAAIQNARWCSSDPICIQSVGQGPESCNLAACHNCALLPETCCEVGNRLLDRALIVGDLNDKDIGFFSDMIDGGK